MPYESALKSRILNEKDRLILMILQKNARESLTHIAKQVGLSIDSVNKRIKEMQRKKIFEFWTAIDPKAIGFPLTIDIKIKLQNITEDAKNQFINHLKNHPRVIDLFSTVGDTDITCVFIAKNAPEFEKISTEIRQKFSNIIADWRGILVLKVHKLEFYDLNQSESVEL